MATQVPGFAASFGDLAIALFTSSEVTPRARLIAQQAAELFPDSAAVVYVLERDPDPMWVPKSTAGDVAWHDPKIPLIDGTLGAIVDAKRALLFSGADLPREAFAHLSVRRTLSSLVAIPLVVNEELVGAIEVLSFGAPLTESSLGALAELSRLAGLGIAAGVAYEAERNSNLESITRLAQMYDLEKVFNSTLEMEDLTQLITSKFHELLKCQAVNLWMVLGDEVVLMGQTGTDLTANLGDRQSAGHGMVGDVADKGEAVLIDDPGDLRLQQRNGPKAGEKLAVHSLIAAPLMSDGAEVGVVEAINKLDGTPFDEDDLFLLTTISETASNALHNASLLLAERKVEILETLVKVSHEITSTLNLDRVLQTIVNAPQAVIPYERAAIALEQGGRLKLGAISGLKDFRASDPEIKPLNELLQWAALASDDMYVRQHGDEIDDPREETRAKFHAYFAETGARGFCAIPLLDDSGPVGILALESSDPDFLSEAHLEMVKVLAAQATVALRNAQMYKEVPFIGLLEPVLKRKRGFLAMPRQRRWATVAAACALVLFLAFFPVPLRLVGNATVAPARSAQVGPEIEGVIKKVYVREGDPVQPGTVLADLEDWNYRGALAEARAKYETAVSTMNRALATNDGTEAGIQRVQADYWSAELKRAEERLDRTHLRSPIAGVIATPHIEDLVGRHLNSGDVFAQVIDSSKASVDVAIDEDDVSLLRQAGEKAAVKLDGFPTRTFNGTVMVVSPKSGVENDRRVFYARVMVPNEASVIRSGMQGRGKVSIGWHPAGYVLFRGPATWIYSKLWAWFGV
ncbi:MAG: GAF domain-containing protein [Acidobacteria bacterium]|nr:GAF domain-containing protein [Acidobacteriota bacterium]